MTWNDLERQFTALWSVLCVLWPNGGRPRLELRRFRCEVALYLSNLRIKFDDEIEKNPFEFQVWFWINLSSVVCNTNALWQNNCK